MRKLAFIVVLLSAGILLWKIHLYPVTVSIFESSCGLTAMKIMEGDKEAISTVWSRPKAKWLRGSSESNRNPVIVYPIGIFFKLFGHDPDYVSLRLTSIMYGVLSVWLMYLLMGKMFNPQIGLVAAFLLATSCWFITLSRFCSDFVPTIFFSIVCYYIYSVADRRKNPVGYIILGAVMAIAPYFYLPARLVAVVVFSSIVLRTFIERGYFKTYYWSLILMVVAFIIVIHLEGIDPVRYFNMKNRSSEWCWNRPQAKALNSTFSFFVGNLKLIFNRFFISWGWFPNLISERGACLDPVSRWCLVIGMIWACLKIKEHKYRFLLIWLVASLMPLVLTFLHPKRALLVIPAFCALAAIGICNSAFLLTSRLKHGRKIIILILILPVLGSIGRLNLINYFGLYREGCYTRSLLINKNRREKFIELLQKYTIYTDIFCGEYGWPQSGQFEAKRLKREEYYKPGPAKMIRQSFEKAPVPCALLLKSGEVKIREKNSDE